MLLLPGFPITPTNRRSIPTERLLVGIRTEEGRAAIDDAADQSGQTERTDGRSVGVARELGRLLSARGYR